MNYEYFSYTTLFLIFQDKPDKRKNIGTQGLGYKRKCEDKSSNDDTEEQKIDSPEIDIIIRQDLPDFKKWLEDAKSTRKRRKLNTAAETHYEERTGGYDVRP